MLWEATPSEANAFAEAWYWSSTQSSAVSASACVQYFTNGYQYYGHKDGGVGRARAVRRLAIR